MSRPQLPSLVPFLALLVACQAGPRPLSEADKTTLRDNDQHFAQLALAKNWAMLASRFTSDGEMLPPNEPAVKGRAAIQAWMTAYPPISAFTVETPEIDGVGDFAYTRGAYTITVTLPGATSPVQDHGKYLAISRKQADGSWLITHDIFNSDVPLAPPPAAPAAAKRKP